MTHPNPDRLWLYHHDALEADERAAVEAHLAEGCDACAGTLGRLRDGAGTLALGAPAALPPEPVRARILGRVGLANPLPPAVSSGAAAPRRVTRGPGGWQRVAVAAGLVGIGVLLGWGANRALAPDTRPRPAEASGLAAATTSLAEARAALEAQVARLEAAAGAWQTEPADGLARLAQQRDAALQSTAVAERLARTNADLSAALRSAQDRLRRREEVAVRLTRERDTLSRALTDANEAMALLESPGVEWVVLSPEGASGPGSARFFWAWERGNCMVDAGNLPRIPAEQSFALWITYESGGPTLVGTFVPEHDGTVRLLAPLPEGEGEVRAVHITVEADPRPTQPGGQTLLAGELF